MSNSRLAPELERRLEQVEREAETSPRLAAKDWLFLFLSGVAFPALLLIWGGM
ncbi:hypothetical protein [Roseovarius pelagicus]|uniref:Uncharacterized protein n=1 Tax=Roseovarius pelagicus TaxID=2980108 RepID=A0ABY6DF50_9RHOB|nr:hypothetical protein [Roseovarius pelagicus]UXX84781.1 hypothetical protein N7U68_09135 [Roseovarius pelagicus]